MIIARGFVNPLGEEKCVGVSVGNVVPKCSMQWWPWQAVAKRMWVHSRDMLKSLLTTSRAAGW